LSHPAVVVLASRIGAGKSTLALALQKFAGFPIASFGRYVKSIAVERNLPLNRETLQNLGEELVISDPASFTRCALAGVDFNEGVIVDGLRHLAVLDSIRCLAGEVATCLVFLQTEDRVRLGRLLVRGMSQEEVERADLHIMEKSLDEQLLPIADLVLDGTSSRDANTGAIIAWIRTSGSTCGAQIDQS
jgi:cytidylate kinase